MLEHRFLSKIREIIDRIEHTQAEQIDAAAEVVATALTSGHGFFISSIGHGNDGDLLGRAGGLMALKSFGFSFNVNSPVGESLRDRPRPGSFDAEYETVRLAVKASQLRAGDCLIVGSVSGRNAGPISLALAAQEIGVTVIALTSLEYTHQVKSLHPTGKRLCEVADIVIDNCVPFGDACLEVEGLPVKAFPLSGIAATTICWMLCALVVEKLLQRGLQPHIYMSANREGGPQFNQEQEAEYDRLGY